MDILVCNRQTLQIPNIQRRETSLADLGGGGISGSVLEGAGKVGQDLDGQGGEVEIVQTVRTAGKSKATKANATQQGRTDEKAARVKQC